MQFVLGFFRFIVFFIYLEIEIIDIMDIHMHSKIYKPKIFSENEVYFGMDGVH
jgi:hypothetical protein